MMCGEEHRLFLIQQNGSEIEQIIGSERVLWFALFHCHSVVRKQPMFLTAHHVNDRKFNEFSKNI